MTLLRCAKISNVGRWACLLGAVVFATIAAVSGWHWLRCVGTVAGQRVAAGVERGTAYLYVSKDWPERSLHPAWYFVTEPVPPSYPYIWWGWGGLLTLTSGSAWFRQVAFPSWLPVLILGASSAALWRVHSATRRRFERQCHSCGYDHTKLPTTAPCPECGKIPYPS